MLLKSWQKVIFAIIVLVLLLAATVYVFHKAGCFIFNTQGQRDIWHKKTKELFANIKPGLTQSQLLELARLHGWSDIRTYVGTSQVRLYSPFEYPASNWILIFDFANGKLTSARVRRESQDFDTDSKYKPKDAPEDIVYSRDVNDTG